MQRRKSRVRILDGSHIFFKFLINFSFRYPSEAGSPSSIYIIIVHVNFVSGLKTKCQYTANVAFILIILSTKSADSNLVKLSPLKP